MSPSPARAAPRARPTRRSSRAARVTRIEIVNNRVVANYMETRGIVAEYDAGDRALHADLGHPGRPRHARPHRQGHPRHLRRTSAGHHARRRRRLRHQGLLLPGISACGDRGQAPRAAGQVDQRPQRALPHRRPWPRQFRGRRDGDGRERQVPRHARRPPRQHGRLSLAVRAVHSRGRADDARPASTTSRTSTRSAAASTPTPSPSTPIAAPAGRRPPIWSSAWSTSAAATPASARSRSAAATSSGRSSCPTRRRAAASTTAASSTGISTARSTVADWKGFEARAAAAKAARQGPRLRHRHLCRGLRLPRQGGGDGPPQRRRHASRIFIGTQTNGQGHATAYAQFVAGHMGLDYDKIQRRPGRHRPGAERRRHRRLALDPARRGLGQQRRGQARRPGQAHRRRPARSRGRRPRTCRRQRPRRRHQPRRHASPNSPQAAEGPDAADRVRRFLRAARADLPERHPYRRGRDRSRDRRHRDRQLRRSSTISARR